MNRKGIWIAGGALVLAVLIFGLSGALAQRDFRTSPRTGGDAPFARYQVVSVNESEVILMDVTTGDLYSAKPRDVKPYSSRPRPGTFHTDKDKAPAFFDKDGGDKDRKYDFKEKDKK
jgi:hypothetical protein